MPSSDQLKALGKMLRELADAQPENRASLEIWEARAAEVESVVAADAALSDAIPHAVWHFLSDADIRMKDVEYRASQIAEVLPAIEAFERGLAPVDAA